MSGDAVTSPIDPELLRTLLIVLACSGLFLIIVLSALVALLLAGTRRARVAFDRWMTPDPAQLALRLTVLRRRHPAASDAALLTRVINDQSLKAGLVGALTGVGGILTLPIAIPVDFALSARIQAATIHFIAQTFAPDQSADTLRLQTYAILAGQRFSQQWAEASSRAVQAAIAQLIRRLVAETVAESLLKIVPFVGAVVGFAFNYATTRLIGRLAVQWYTERRTRTTIETTKGSLP